MYLWSHQDRRQLVGLPMNGVPLSGSGTAIMLFAKTDIEHLQKNLTQFLDNWEIDAPAQGLTILLPNDFDMASLGQLDIPQRPVFAKHNKTENDLEITKSIGGRRPCCFSQTLLALFAMPNACEERDLAYRKTFIN